jgi:hypothetical protein
MYTENSNFVQAEFRAGVEFRASSKIEIQNFQKNVNFELDLISSQLEIKNFQSRISSRRWISNQFKDLKFGCFNFWISIFELARYSTLARVSAFSNFELQSSSWLSAKLDFWKFRISICELAQTSTPHRNSAFSNFEFRSLSWLEIQLKL